MFSLGFTSATHNPCLILLREKGYALQVSCGRRGNGDSFCNYVATAEGRRFSATSGAELLGLVTLWEHFGEGWNRQTPDIVDEVIVNEDEAGPGAFVTGA
jgi:hypothetical protein